MHQKFTNAQSLRFGGALCNCIQDVHVAGCAHNTAAKLHARCGDAGHAGVGAQHDWRLVAWRSTGPLPPAPHPHNPPAGRRRSDQHLIVLVAAWPLSFTAFWAFYFMMGCPVEVEGVPR